MMKNAGDEVRARPIDPEERRIKIHGPRPISTACARPAGWPPRCSTSSRRMSCRASPPTSSTGSATASSSITAPSPRRSTIAAFRARSAPRSTMSSATAFPATGGCSDGDIVNIDVTAILDGWHGDTSRMFLVGERVPAEGAAPGRRHLRGDDARHRGGEAGRAHSAISAMPSRALPRRSASPSCAISAAMASAASSTTRRRSCISARRATGRC